MVDTVSVEDDGECSGEPRTVRVVCTIDRPKTGLETTDFRVENETRIDTVVGGRCVVMDEVGQPTLGVAAHPGVDLATRATRRLETLRRERAKDRLCALYALFLEK